MGGANLVDPGDECSCAQCQRRTQVRVVDPSVRIEMLGTWRTIGDGQVVWLVPAEGTFKWLSNN
jgi:hypothetical protein